MDDNSNQSPPESKQLRPAENPMNQSRTTQVTEQQQSIGIGDIYYAIFRHKWKILTCSLLGLIGATAYYLTYKPPFISEAKLFIRYVVTEGKASGPIGDSANTKSPDMRGETIMESEEQILTSLDLAKQVAEAIGPDKILAKAGGGKDLNKAAMAIRRGITVDVPRSSSVILITFQHPDVEVVQPVLREFVDRYLKMHVEIHRAVGIIGDFLTQETDQLRNRLSQTEDELRKAKNRAGIISIEDSKKTFSGEMSRLRDELFAVQTELAERSSVFAEVTKGTGATAAPTSAAIGESQTPTTPSSTPPEPLPDPGQVVPIAKVNEYRLLLAKVDFLRRREQELLLELTPENARVKGVHGQLIEANQAKLVLEDQFPALVRPTTSGVPNTVQASNQSTFDAPLEAAKINALQAKLKIIANQLESVKAEASKVEQAEGSILELLRKKELEEANYRYYAARLEQSRINEALGSGKVSNISQIQTPTPPFTDLSKVKKIPSTILGAGIGIGLAWAFLIELLLDRTVRRPIDFERSLNLPLFLSIPALGKKGWLRKSPFRKKDLLSEAEAKLSQQMQIQPEHDQRLTEAHIIRQRNVPLLHKFHETLRDRLIGYFESRNLTHKPKLLAVTGLDRGSGVTTTAAGLASCLSETGEGNVLLVDMTAGQGSAQQFYRGKQICGLDEILATRDHAQVHDKLFVVAEEPGHDRLSRILPQRFSKLIPQLKASNFDYIIFDMPAVSQLSITPRLAGFMDMVLLVVESEKTDREMVQHATALLAQSKAHVGAILNKSKNYVPEQLHQDTLRNF